MLRIILASKSPRRKKLLTQLGFKFEVHPSDINEDISQAEPGKLVEQLALLKAGDVARHFPNSFIIGADTIVVHSGEILGKPKDETEAAEMLMRLSGSIHSVFTGVTLAKTDEKGFIDSKKTFYEQTNVQFSTLTFREIQAYIKSGSPLDKAGAYGIQDDLGAVFVEKIVGDYYNVVGFPLNRFYRELKNFNPELANISFNA
ncbi:MAG: Maf family protein [Balneolaceae bacterium]